MLANAIEEAGYTEQEGQWRGKLEGMVYPSLDGGGTRPSASDEHQAFQNMYIGTFGRSTGEEPFDEEGTGWGWRLVATFSAEDLPSDHLQDGAAELRASGASGNRRAQEIPGPADAGGQRPEWTPHDRTTFFPRLTACFTASCFS